ncbi:hybrid sensor histidine kinase/response regulator [Halorarius litoreus]|uniref:hybrid sensor histidine kinase/response regulator n=1 Tax=Halorarius litoreus TaxID=2962676 RepID=UPI0020CDF70D|nr:PAS domain S-box protein [Halorarius litoreus]
MGSVEVVYVADDAADGSAVVDALTAAGFSVTPVHDCSAALETVPSVDCLVCSAPFSDGGAVSLCGQVRSRHPDIPVVIYAAVGDASEASAAFAVGATDYVLREEVPPERFPTRLSTALARGDLRYRQLVEPLGDVVYVTDADGRFLAVNGASEDVTGYAREELVGSHVSLVLSDEDIERGEAAIRDLLSAEGPETVRFELSVRTREGETIPVENHVALLPMPDDEFRGTVGVLRDISGRQARDRRLRELHDATRQLMAATTPEEIADITVQAASDVLGYPINGVRLVRGAELVPVAVPEQTRELLGERPVYPVDGDSLPATALREGEPVVYDDLSAVATETPRGGLGAGIYLPLGDHGTLSIAAQGDDVFDDSERQLATVLAANAAAALDRVSQRVRLEAEHDRFAALFENIPDPTIYVEFEGFEPVVRDANPAFEQVFGVSVEQVYGESIDDYLLPDESARGDARRFNELIQSGESFHGEVQRVAADGVRDFLLHVVPYAVGERSTRGFAIYTDITDQKERERELRRQNQRLDEFASVVSHDLRNPLNVALGRMEMARETGDAEDFEAVEAALSRMESLIEGLLGLARQGQAVGEPAVVDVGQVAELAWSAVDTGDAELVVADPPLVEGDGDRLQQLFENLFANAVEHAGAAPTVTVGALDDGFYVADDGPGIDPDDRDHLFEFGHSGGDGTGFGLAIVEQIVEAHGWSIAVVDAPGARFEIAGVSSI